MKKSLFRLIDKVELLSLYILCFGFNIMFDYIKTLSIDSHLLKTFLEQFYKHRVLIIFLLTFIIIIFHYQMLNRKKLEIYCRILVGSTILSIVLHYILECFTILSIAFTISILINTVLDIGLTNNIYLSCILLVYILTSSGIVNKLENF